MDYEKKIREYLNSSEVDQLYKSMLSNLFPELVEPKEEKARRSLLEFLEDLFKLGKNINFNRWSKADCEEWVNWVMKQGEQKSVPDWMPKFLDELRSKKNYFDWDEHKDIEGGILAIINWMNPNYFNEKDGEQKPAEWSKEHYELEEFAKIVRGNLTGISKAVQKLFEAKYLQLTGNKMYGGFKD